jgi:hypothetical protein
MEDFSRSSIPVEFVTTLPRRTLVSVEGFAEFADNTPLELK